MKKVFAAGLSVVLGCVFLAAIAGCSKNISSITDFKRYSDLQSRADKIDVQFDNHTGTPFEFSVTDEADLKEIMEILLSEKLRRFDGIFDGDHTVLVLYQGEKTYSVSVHANRENEVYYGFSTSKLRDKIASLAAAMGASAWKIHI